MATLLTGKEADKAIENIKHSMLYQLDQDVRDLVVAWERGDMQTYDTLSHKLIARMLAHYA